ncbi:hypothetical protein Len3610_13745 [Lentibacillus sp. CBA3610]|nr:hypothetical protein Len3610_13745 [Lentibacillus sp. CBA3610]
MMCPAESFELTVDVLTTSHLHRILHTMGTGKHNWSKKWQEENGNKKIHQETNQFYRSRFKYPCLRNHGVQQCLQHSRLVDVKAHIILGAHTSNNASDHLGFTTTLEHGGNVRLVKRHTSRRRCRFFSANNNCFQ